MSLYQRCVHLGCRVPFCNSSKWFECPCHGSKYNNAGEYKLGPAPRGLDRFQMAVVDGSVIVDTSTIKLGPPRGTNTTDQPLEGPYCVATGMIASTNYAAVTLIAAGGASDRRHHRGAGAPPPRQGHPRPRSRPAMRPGPSDHALETPLLLKLQGWGVVLVTFFVLWFPVQWLVEPGPNLKQEEALNTDVDRTRTAGRPALLRGQPARRRVRRAATATSCRAA